MKNWALKFNFILNRKQNKNRNKISEVNSFQEHMLKRLGSEMGNFSVLGTTTVHCKRSDCHSHGSQKEHNSIKIILEVGK